MFTVSEKNVGLQNALNLACAHLQFKKFPEGNTPDPFKRGREGGEGRGRARKWNEGKIEGWGQERKVQRGKGREVPLSQILDTPLTVQHTPDRG
jgi:hypothetical protein